MPLSLPVWPARVNPSLTMGNPSRAAANPANKNNYLLVKPYYAVSYNDAKGTPNWVSWRLTAKDIGDAPRSEFYPDKALPAGFKTVTPTDYTGSGFDRGHLCPHQDRSANDAMSESTFAMTNIIPQSPNLNQRAWEQLESYCRTIAEQGNVLYVISGPSGVRGIGRNGPRETVGEEHPVTVPSKCWKVIMVLKAGPGNDVTKVDRRTRLIAVVMPNNMRVGQSWAQYRVPVTEVEKLTGYRFFGAVSKRIIDPLKKKADATPISRPKRAWRGQ